MAFRAGVEVCAKDSLSIFAAPDSDIVIGELEVTELCYAAGGLVQCGAYSMLPIVPCGAVRADGVEILESAVPSAVIMSGVAGVPGAAVLPVLAQVMLISISRKLQYSMAFFSTGRYAQQRKWQRIRNGDGGPGPGGRCVKCRCATSGLYVIFFEMISPAGESHEMRGARPEAAMCDHDLKRAILLERERLEKRSRIMQALEGNNRHTPESAMRAADRSVQAAAEAVKLLQREVEVDRAYRAATVQTMYGPRTREQNNAGLRAWAEGLLGERRALISGGAPDDADEARLWERAVGMVDAKIKSKRVEGILADVLGRMERSAAREAALQQACARLCVVEEQRAKLASAHVGCLDTAMARQLVEESREQLTFLEREWSQRGPPALTLVDEKSARIERNRARAVELRAAKRARLGEQP